MKTKISKDDYYRIVGLLTLAEDHNKALRDIEGSLARLLEMEPDGKGDPPYYGHVTDAVGGCRSAAELLDLLEIEVVEVKG